MFYIKLFTQAVEFMFPGSCAFSQAKKTVCKFLAIVCKYPMNGHGTCSVKITQDTQEASGIGCTLGFVETDKNPSSRAIYTYEKDNVVKFHLAFVEDISHLHADNQARSF